MIENVKVFKRWWYVVIMSVLNVKDNVCVIWLIFIKLEVDKYKCVIVMFGFFRWDCVIVMFDFFR